MKILSVIGFVASCCLVGFVPAAIAQNQNNNSLTCRSALEGTTLAEIQAADAQCCYVLEETEWYNANNVLLRHFYQRQDDARKYLTVECHIDDGSGASNVNGASDPSLDPVSSIVPSSSVEGLPSSSSSSDASGNPGNDKPVGGAGESPNGDASGFKPAPGTQGQSN